MSMPVPVLARDSLNFFRNQLLSVLIISLLTAAVTVGLNVLLTYNSNGLALIRAWKPT
ncbi:membrane protein, partial [Morganella morganii]